VPVAGIEYNHDMDIEIRSIGPDRFREFSRVIETAFGETSSEEQLADYQRGFEFDRSIAAFDGDRIVGTGGADSMDLTLPGLTTIPVGGLTAISVLPTYRRRGILRAIMTRHLEEVESRGEPVSALLASESVIYGRFGYGQATASAELEIDTRHGAFLRPPAGGGRLRLLDQDELLKVVQPFYDRARRAQPGELSRGAWWWELYARDPEWTRDGASPHQDVVYEAEPGRVDGWVSYRIQTRWADGLPSHQLRARQLFALTPEAGAALWRHCLDYDLAATVRLDTRPLDDPLRWYLADPRRLRTVEVGDHLWLRLLDLPAAMTARRYATEGRLVLDVRDPLRPRNQGRWLLEGGPDGASCTPTRAEADLSLEVTDLGAAYLGGSRLATMARAGRVQELTAGALVRADAMLASDPPPWTTTHF
jgi:predicted acetyltransferase